MQIPSPMLRYKCFTVGSIADWNIYTNDRVHENLGNNFEAGLYTGEYRRPHIWIVCVLPMFHRSSDVPNACKLGSISVFLVNSQKYVFDSDPCEVVRTAFSKNLPVITDFPIPPIEVVFLNFCDNLPFHSPL